MATMNREQMLLVIQQVGANEVMESITRLNAKILDTAQVTKTLGISAKTSEDAIKRIGTEARIQEKALHRFKMSLLTVGLSSLFAGMALQRFSRSILTGLFDTLRKVEGSQTSIEVATMRMTASFEFLKFAIMDALSGTFIESALLGIAELLAKMADFASEHPIVTQALFAIVIAIGVVGTALMLLGQMFAAWSGWAGLFGGANPLAKAFLSFWTPFWTAVMAIPGAAMIAAALKWVLIIGAAIAAIIAVLEMSGIETHWEAILKSMSDGWTLFWDGILYGDSAKVSHGFQIFFASIGAMFNNIFVGVMDLVMQYVVGRIVEIVGYVKNIGILLSGQGLKPYLEAVDKDKTSAQSFVSGRMDRFRTTPEMIANKNAKLEVERATKGMTEQEKSAYMLNRAIELQKKKLGLTKESLPKDQAVVDVYEDTKKQLDGLVSSTEQYSSGAKTAEDILSDYESQLQNVSTSINGTNGSTQQLVDLQGQLQSLTDNTTTSMADLTAIMGTYGSEGSLADSISQVGESADGLGDSFTGISQYANMTQASFIGVNTEIKGIPDNLFLSQEAAVNAGTVIGAKTDLMQTDFMNVTGKVAGLKQGVDNLKQSVDNLSDKTITITTIYKTKYESEGSSSKTNTTTKTK